MVKWRAIGACGAAFGVAGGLVAACGGQAEWGETLGETEAGLSAPAAITEFAVLASGRATFRDRAQVIGGHIGVAPGSGDSLTAGFDTKLALGKATQGQRVVLRDRAALGDLFADTVVGTRGTTTSLSPYVAPPAPPPLASVTPGTTGVTVNSPRTLAAGDFADVVVNSTLTLSGGTYQLRNLTLGHNAVIQASAPSILRVAGAVRGGDRVRLLPTGSQGAAALRIMVAGANDASGGMVLGSDAAVTALIVSRASFSAGDRFAGSGAIAALNVSAGFDARMTFAGGFECNADAACDDTNPCTADACVDAQCVHGNVANGTACIDDGNACTSDVCSNGSCAHGAVTNGTPCASDGNECTSDTCSGGVCTHPALANGTACADDANSCTSDTCSSGACTHPALADGTACGSAGGACAAGSCAVSTCTSGSSGGSDNTGTTTTISFGGQTVTRTDSTAIAADRSLTSVSETTADGVLVLRQTFQLPAARDRLSVTTEYGAAFHGISRIELVTEGTTTTGSIDGRELAPFPSDSTDPSSIRFADGSALPILTQDPGTMELLAAIAEAASSASSSCAARTALAAAEAGTPLAAEFPPFPPSPFIFPGRTAGEFAGCDDCKSDCQWAYAGCYALTLAKCTPLNAVPLAGIALAAACTGKGIYDCNKTEDRCYNGCNEPGAVCCPKRCEIGCCQASQTCLGRHSPALCCDAGFATCSGPQGDFCIDPAEATCLPSGIPCANGTPICGSGENQVCCPGVCSGDQCLPSADFNITLHAEVTQIVTQFRVCGEGRGFSPNGAVELSFGPTPGIDPAVPNPGGVFAGPRAREDGSFSFNQQQFWPVVACGDPNQLVTVTARDEVTNATVTATLPGRFFCTNGGFTDFNGGCP